MIAPEHVAAVVVFIAALVGFGANPLARWWARNEANTDRIIAEALDRPDYEGNVVAFDRLGRTR